MLKPHRFAELFPALPAEELRELTQSIKAFGQRELATVYQGTLLDGCSRAAACDRLGRPLKTRTFRGSEADALAFVLDVNVRRRHLTESQRAMIASRVATLHVGRPGKNASGEAISQKDAGKMLGVGRASVQRARYVQDHGTPAEVRSVERGTMALKALEHVLRHRQDDAREDRDRDANQLQRYGKRLVELARDFTELARRMQRLSGTMHLSLAEYFSAEQRKVMRGAAEAVDGLLGGG